MLTVKILGTNDARFPEHLDPQTGETVFEVEDESEGFIQVKFSPPPALRAAGTFCGGTVHVDGQLIRKILIDPRTNGSSIYSIGVPGPQGTMLALKFCTKDSGRACVEGSTHSTRGQGLPSFGGIVTVEIHEVQVRSAAGPRGTYAFEPRAEVSGSEKKSDGMHVEAGSSHVPSHSSNLSICKWGPEICKAQAFYASDFQLTVAQVKKSGVEMPRKEGEPGTVGPKVAERRKRKMEEMEKNKGKDKRNPIEL